MKTCLLEPIEEIFLAAEHLNEAVSFHLAGNQDRAAERFRSANMSAIRQWTESVWGADGIYSQFTKELGKPVTIPSALRDPSRMPDSNLKAVLIERDGLYCRFCGIPVIRKEVRVKLHTLYPEAIPWGSTNPEQHAAFQAMWLQYDHIIPHARGGKTILENMIITCAPCNYGRMNFLLEEVGLTLKNYTHRRPANWDGLERVMS